MTSFNGTGRGPDRDTHKRVGGDGQGDLFTGDTGDDTQQPLSTTEKFERFATANPHVYDLLVDLARQWMRATGRRRLGIAQLWERMRWDLALATDDPDFKINNDFKAFYSRLLMLQEPDLADLFDTRRSVADDWAAGREAA